MKLASYKELKVWQRSVELVEEIYKLTKSLPEEEKYALASQMRRAAVSIPSNIAEGYKRTGTTEYIRFLNIAEASAAELETHLILINRLYLKTDTQQAEQVLLEVQKMLVVLIKKLTSSIKNPKS